MKLNTLFVVGVCASTLFVSCNPVETGNQRQLSNNHTSLVDGDAYQFFQKVSTRAVYENDYASYAGNVAGSPQAKELAAKAQELYTAMIPALDSLAVIKQLDFPIKGAAKFVAPAENVTEEVEADSAAVQEAVTSHAAADAYSDEAYVLHVQHEAALIKEQLERMTRNTDTDVRAFAASFLDAVSELYTSAGGQEEAHGHH